MVGQRLNYKVHIVNKGSLKGRMKGRADTIQCKALLSNVVSERRDVSEMNRNIIARDFENILGI
jgi:hypothetical protein